MSILTRSLFIGFFITVKEKKTTRNMLIDFIFQRASRKLNILKFASLHTDTKFIHFYCLHVQFGPTKSRAHIFLLLIFTVVQFQNWATASTIIKFLLTRYRVRDRSFEHLCCECVSIIIDAFKMDICIWPFTYDKFNGFSLRK